VFEIRYGGALVIPKTIWKKRKGFRARFWAWKTSGRRANSPMSCFKLSTHNFIHWQVMIPLSGPWSRIAVCRQCFFYRAATALTWA